MSYLWIISIILLSNYGTSSSMDDSDIGCKLTPPSNGNSNRDNVLSSLKYKGLFDKSFSYNEGNIVYKMKLCNDADTSVPNGSVIKMVNAQIGKYPIGFRNETHLVSGNGWTLFTFGGGTPSDNILRCENPNSTLITNIMLLCEEQNYQGSFVLSNSDTEACSFTFTLSTNLVCSDVYSGMSGWSIFFLILFLGLLGYFITGFFYLRCVVGAKGVDQFPHKDFWFRLGNVIADGCDAMCRCDRYCGASEATGILGSPHSDYSPIGGTTSPTLVPPSKNEPDTALLNP